MKQWAKLYWKDFFYELHVSDQGDVYYYLENGRKKIPKVITFNSRHGKYLGISLYYNGEKWDIPNLGRLIFQAFNQSNNRMFNIEFKDGDYTNLKLDNLMPDFKNKSTDKCELRYPERKCIDCIKYPCMHDYNGNPTMFSKKFASYGCRDYTKK